MSDRETLLQQIETLKEKQALIDAAWQKTGNKPLLQFFVEIIPRTLSADRCSIFVLDPSRDNVWVECGTQLNEMQISVPRQGSMVGEVISTGRPIIRNELEQMSGAHGWVDSITGFTTRNAVCVPINGVTSKQVVGAIQVLNTREPKKKFTEEDRAILEKLAFHIEVNIESIFLKQEWAKVLQELTRKIKKLEVAAAKAPPA